MKINIPAKRNPLLESMVKKVNEYVELEQIYKSVNINAVNRAGMPDHGPVHIKIITNIALRMLRLLHDSGIKTSIENDHDLSYKHAEVVVFLGALLHDIGISVHRDQHEMYSAVLAAPILDDLLHKDFGPNERFVMRSEILHAIVAHHGPTRCLTVEAGVVKVADALDMSEGRSRISFEAGEINIFSVSSMAVEGVKILSGESKPVRIEIEMNNSAGIFQIDELLKRKLQNSSIKDMVEIVALIDTPKEKKIVSIYEL